MSASTSTTRQDPGDLAELTLRQTRVRAAMADEGLDLVIAFAPGWRRENVRYFTDAGLTGTASLVLFPATGDPSAFSTRRSDLPELTRPGWVREAASYNFV